MKNLLLHFAFVFAFACFSFGQTKPAPTPKTISGGILNGKASFLPKPEYPPDALRAGVSGTVKVQVLIDETGMVVSAKAVSGPENASLRQACEAAAMRSTFSPTLLSGQPAKVSGVISYNFIGQSNEERLKVLGVSAFIGMSRHFVSDWSKLKVAFEGDDLIKQGVTEFPEFGSEFAGLTKLDNLTTDKRREAVDKALSSIKAKVDPSGRWQFDVGQELAQIFGPMMFLMSRGGEPDLSTIDEPAIRLSLNKIRDLTLSAPADFPPDVLQKLKEFAALGSKDNLLSVDNFEEFGKRMLALLETISPETGK